MSKRQTPKGKIAVRQHKGSRTIVEYEDIPKAGSGEHYKKYLPEERQRGRMKYFIFGKKSAKEGSVDGAFGNRRQ